MKIKDLIEKLKEYDSEKDIVIYSCDSDLIEYGPLGFYENEGQVELHIDEGIKLQFRMILMWHHPKYYKELAKKRKQLEREQANERASEQARRVGGPTSNEPGSEQASDQASEEDSSNKR